MSMLSSFKRPSVKLVPVIANLAALAIGVGLVFRVSVFGSVLATISTGSLIGLAVQAAGIGLAMAASFGLASAFTAEPAVAQEDSASEPETTVAADPQAQTAPRVATTATPPVTPRRPVSKARKASRPQLPADEAVMAA